MAELRGKWVELEQKGSSPGARSSHAIAILGKKVYSFGGEISPRVPVDNKLYIFDLEDETWSVADACGDIPPPRVGVTMAAVGETIYVFGGRDCEHKELDELYSFDTRSNKWTLVTSGEEKGHPHPHPPGRSYHSVAADDRHVYIFGGCGEKGRLNDLWTYDAVDKEWIQHPVPPGEAVKGRGGAGLAVVGGKVWVVYGFAGMEVDDVHCFDLSEQKWMTGVETRGDQKPSARSVFSTTAIGKHICIFGGEVDPSDLGHLGAGKFSGEFYALDTETLVWKKIEEEEDNNSTCAADADADAHAHHPGPRGWCAFGGGERDGKPGLLVYGGNSPSNDRLDDIFFFTLTYY